MRKLIISALLAATMASGFTAPAAAQSRNEIRQDRQDVRHDRRDVQQPRREVRQDRRDYRRDDWRSYRQSNRVAFARGHWRSPYRYHAFRPGVRIGAGYFGPRYSVANPWHYRLPPARGHQRWVRHYDDVLLVDTRRGVVIDVIRNFFW